MNVIKEIILRRILQIYHDKNLRVSFFTILVIILLSTMLLSFKIGGKRHFYNLGDIAKEDISVPRDISYINEEETEIEKKIEAESIPVVFDKDASLLYERLNTTRFLFTNIISTLEDNPPIGTDDLTFQLISLKTKLPKYMQYNIGASNPVSSLSTTINISGSLPCLNWLMSCLVYSSSLP